ncbi:MAG: hypothetical protein ACHQ53_08340, partial [Polyangiales bacterium]
MADVPEAVARVGLACWVGESERRWDTPAVLGMIGDELYLVEIDGHNRELVLLDIIDKYDGGDRGLRIEIAFFGDAGGFFASSMDFLEHWPKSPADVPADVFIDNHHKAAFTRSGDDIVMSVRHALRSAEGPPRRRFRFRPHEYEKAMSDLARESRRLRDDLLAAAQESAPQKIESLR